MTNEFFTELTDRLNPEERIFKFRSAELDGCTLTVDLLVRSTDYDKFLDDRLKNKVRETARSLLPDDIETKIRFFKAFADESSVINKIIEYVFKEHKSVYPIFAAAKYVFESEGDICTVSVTLEKYVCEYVRGINLAREIHDYLDGEFIEEVEIAFVEIPNTETEEVLPEKFYVSTTRVVDAKIVKAYGKSPQPNPKYICDVEEKAREDNSVTVCGVISDINSRKIVKKDAKGRENEKELFTFLVSDTTASLRCKFFARERKDFLWSDVICDNKKVVLEGSYIHDSFDNRFCLMVNAIAEAEIDFNTIDKKSNYNIDYGRYMYVVPEPYNDVAQNYMFDTDTPDPDALKGTTYVAFDLETTGLNVESDEIIEIAAIKIVDGQFTEKFSTFVKPSHPIPKRITEITGINDETVASSPSAGEVIPDFYRFAKGCTLVGHNIGSFDIPLLNSQAAKCKYEFNNTFIDTLSLARGKLRLSKYKLADVCEALNVPLIGAHRAINDVAANAKAFLKLINK
ncbi:MAG: exonuclease domain-containing protein [Christensenellales bacterium]